MQKIVYKKASRVAVQRNIIPAPHHQTKSRRFVHIIPAVLVTLGSMLIANVLWPIISYQLFVSPSLQKQALLSPVADTSFDESGSYIQPVLPVRALGDERIPREPKILTEELDYTNLSQWFPTREIPEVRPEEAITYEIDIPALRIQQAKVKVGGLALDKSLIQYPGTANPGELGSPVIFGHSVSPLFYNPSLNNPRRYVSIFTKIMDLKKGDTITVRYDGITYTYRVTNKMEVKPEDTYILQQRYDVRELKLVTCTPPGTVLRRGIVFAQLEDIQ